MNKSLVLCPDNCLFYKINSGSLVISSALFGSVLHRRVNHLPKEIKRGSLTNEINPTFLALSSDFSGEEGLLADEELNCTELITCSKRSFNISGICISSFQDLRHCRQRCYGRLREKVSGRLIFDSESKV